MDSSEASLLANGAGNSAEQASKKRTLEEVEQGDTQPNKSPRSHQDSLPEPGAKRAKTDLNQQPIQDEARDLESAEEGELKEDREAQLSQSESESEEIAGSQSDGSRASRVGSKASAADGEPNADIKRTTRSMSAAANGPVHVGWNQGITSQNIRTSLGASKAKAVPAPVKAQPISEEAAPVPAPAAVSDTKVAPPSEAAQPVQPAQKGGKLTRKEQQQQQRAEAAALEKQKAQEQQKAAFVYAPGLVFAQPSKKTILQPKGNNLGKAVWKSKLKSWCQSFVSHNNEQNSLLTPDIVLAALQDYITTRAHWSKKKYSAAAITEARKPETRNDIAVNLATLLKDDSFLLGSEESPMVIDDDDEADDSVQEIPNPTEANPEQAVGEQNPTTEDLDPDQLQTDAADDTTEMEQTEPGPAVMTAEEDLAQQRKYFPGLPDSVQVCVYCAAVGHNSAACPKTACKFCQHSGHFSWNCPTRERCTKCRQLGHGRGQCTEKLVLLDEEGMECAACGSHDHLEDDCETLWRSYKPRKELIRKVKAFPAFCASCGTEGHYSSDCALRGNRPRNKTWSLKNRDLYVDKDATDEPISDFAGQPQNPKFPLQIKGSAARRNHIFYPDSDGSEEGEFIGQKVKPRAPLGSIQLSTNLQINTGNFGPPPQTQQNGRGQQRSGWSAQPPLPPGPPPSGPPPGSYSRMSRSFNNQSRPPPPGNGAGRGGLPPKPPAPQSQQHGHQNAGPPSNGRGSNAPKKQRTRNQSGNSHGGPVQQQQQQSGGGPPSRRRGKARRGGKQG